MIEIIRKKDLTVEEAIEALSEAKKQKRQTIASKKRDEIRTFLNKISKAKKLKSVKKHK